MKYSKIIATGSYLPEKVLTNKDLEQLVETNDEWIFERTGIRQRRIIAKGEKTSDMAYQAALKALEMAQMDASEIDLIIVATSTPDAIFPSTSCIVQNKLGIKTKGTFDVQAACTGFIYALTTADCYIRSGMAKTALVIGADSMSRIVDYNDRGTCILFGDGAGAAILQASDEPGILGCDIRADGAYNSILTCDGHLYNGEIQGNPYISMDGQAVFKFAVRSLTAVAKELAKKIGVDLADVNWVIPHQANIRILEATAKLLGTDMAHVVTTVEEHGNTSAASIPLAFDGAVRDGRIQRGDLLLLEGVGAGFSWGASFIKY
ncbi:MAG: ketoacyl-ACP synthase III [Burkholderiales bacterium]|nr:ketoacyl-ACP synthase III [Burkholderiales bacterium]